jgi:hypothetical protein
MGANKPGTPLIFVIKETSNVVPFIPFNTSGQASIGSERTEPIDF